MKALSKLALVIATIVMLSPSAPAATLSSTTGMSASNLGPTANGHRRHRRRRKHPRFEASNAA